jgi:hypothetical protein
MGTSNDLKQGGIRPVNTYFSINNLNDEIITVTAFGMIINLKVSQPSTRSEKITGVVLFVWD